MNPSADRKAISTYRRLSALLLAGALPLLLAASMTDRLFVSPMGEPFRGNGEGGRAGLIAQWFAGADTNHDGKLTLTEFRADAARFFQTLDLNHDGEIDPDELDKYEQSLTSFRSTAYFDGDDKPAAGSGSGGGGGHGGGHGGGGGGHHGHHGGGGEGQTREGYEPLQGAARFGMLNIPEPVASADADMNRGVSLSEFLHAASQRFAALDADHHGALTLEGLPRNPPQPRHIVPSASENDQPAEVAPPM